MPRVSATLVPLERVRAHPTNIRRNLGDLRPLTASIARDGVLVPIIVEFDGQGTWHLHDGHRRTAAATIAGLTRIPAIVHTTRLTEAEWLRQAVTLNCQRKDQAATERAETARRMRLRGLSVQAIADAYGVSRATAAGWIRADDNTNPPRAKPTPPRMVSCVRLAAFVDEWRSDGCASANDVLDALDALLAETTGGWEEW